MDSQNQLSIFCICIGIGFAGGTIYEIFGFFRQTFRCGQGKNKALGAILDILFCLTFAVFCVFLAVLLHFPNFRVYMIVGYAIGGIIYLKTLHRILAIFENVCYNVILEAVKRLKKARKNSQNGGKDYDTR